MPILPFSLDSIPSLSLILLIKNCSVSFFFVLFLSRSFLCHLSSTLMSFPLLQVAEVIFVITSLIKDACGKAPTERLFLDKYGKICLCLDEIVWMVCPFFSPLLRIHLVGFVTELPKIMGLKLIIQPDLVIVMLKS